MTTTDYWAHVSASFVGTAICVGVLAVCGLLAQFILNRRAKGGEGGNNVRPEPADETVDEGKLRVATRRSTSRIPFHDPNDAPEPQPGGRELFEPAVQRRQEQLDAAAVRRGEETQPVAAVRTEMRRVMLCEPPMVEGMTLFSYLKHHARGGEIPEQPWDSEHNGALAAITEALYTGVERDRFVAPVFDGYDLHELRKHFVRALKTLAKDGLDEETADALGRAHERLRIRPEQFDAVIGHFVQALKRFLPPQVFETVFVQLRARDGVVDQLRKRIVTAAG